MPSFAEAKKIRTLSLPAEALRGADSSPKLVILPEAAPNGGTVIYEKRQIASGMSGKVFIGLSVLESASSAPVLRPVVIKNVALAKSGADIAHAWGYMFQREDVTERGNHKLPAEVIYKEVALLSALGASHPSDLSLLTNLKETKLKIVDTAHWGTAKDFAQELSLRNDFGHRLLDTLMWRVAHDLVLQLEKFDGQNKVHGDIKPANIVFVAENKSASFIDFGSADTRGAPATSRTPPYMPPEAHSVASFTLEPSLDMFMTGFSLLEVAMNIGMQPKLAAKYTTQHGSWHVLGELIPVRTWKQHFGAHSQSLQTTTFAAEQQIVFDDLVLDMRGVCLRQNLWQLFVNMCAPEAAYRPSPQQARQALMQLRPQQEALVALETFLPKMGYFRRENQRSLDALETRISRERSKIYERTFRVGHRQLSRTQKPTSYPQIGAFLGTTQQERLSGLRAAKWPGLPPELNMSARVQDTPPEHIFQQIWLQKADVQLAIAEAFEHAIAASNEFCARLLLSVGLRPNLDDKSKAERMLNGMIREGIWGQRAIHATHSANASDDGEKKVVRSELTATFARIHPMSDPAIAAELLQNALLTDDDALAMVLIEFGADVGRIRRSTGDDLLSVAIRKNKPALVTALIDAGAPLSLRGVDKRRIEPQDANHKQILATMPNFLRETHLGLALCVQSLASAEAYLEASARRAGGNDALVELFAHWLKNDAGQLARDFFAGSRNVHATDHARSRNLPASYELMQRTWETEQRSVANGLSISTWAQRWGGFQPRRMAHMCITPCDDELSSLSHRERMQLGYARLLLNLDSFEQCLSYLEPKTPATTATAPSPNSDKPALLLVKAFALIGKKDLKSLATLVYSPRELDSWSERQRCVWGFLSAYALAWQSDDASVDAQSRERMRRRGIEQLLKHRSLWRETLGPLPERLYLRISDSAKDCLKYERQAEAARRDGDALSAENAAKMANDIRVHVRSAWHLRAADRLEIFEDAWVIAQPSRPLTPLGLFT